MLLLLASLWAQVPPPPLPSEAPPLISQTVEELIEAAVQTRQEGNLAAATRLLAELEPRVPAENYAEYLYQRAICAELGLEPSEAQRLYERVIGLQDQRVPDAHLRLAMVLEGLGQYREALDHVLIVNGINNLSEADLLTVQLQRGIAELNLGRRGPGLRNTQEALGQLEGTENSRWMRAKARYTIAQMLYLEAMDIHMTGSDRKAARNLKRRAALMREAEDQILALIAYKETEWILASMVAMGDAYRDWATELRAATPPRKFDIVDQLAWRKEIERYAENADTKAWHAYDEGITLATRLAWESPRVAELKERRLEVETSRRP